MVRTVDRFELLEGLGDVLQSRLVSPEVLQETSNPQLLRLAHVLATSAARQPSTYMHAANADVAASAEGKEQEERSLVHGKRAQGLPSVLEISRQRELNQTR